MLSTILKQARRGQIITRETLLLVLGCSSEQLDGLLKHDAVSSWLRTDMKGRLRAKQDGAANRLTRQKDRNGFQSGDTLRDASGWEYVLDVYMGEGAIGTVWSAENRDGDTVALKLFNPTDKIIARANFGDVRRRFIREGRNGARLSHDGLIKIHDLVETKDHLFLVMDLADGTAATLPSKSGIKRTLQAAASVLLPVCRALSYLHGHGCVHRDVKPDNILGIAGAWVLGDFGIVKWNELNKLFVSASAMTTFATRGLGTRVYMPPEQEEPPHRVVPASDVYALGITWVELVHGEAPTPPIGDNQKLGAASEVGQKSLHDDENAGRRVGSHRVAASVRLS
jgi:serine/threonine protein kinase